jgi:glycosyltransferase involved in cell wall biosynthesis
VLPHISVCVCTYKRKELLRRLLVALGDQKADNLFTYSVSVVDNDSSRSAEAVVHQCASELRLPIEYSVEPRQNISLARNKAVETARGDYVALIDDDEFPIERWLINLFIDCERLRADGVLGPVKPHFDQQPPAWVVRGSFYERERLATGQTLRWSQCRTGNALLQRYVFTGDQLPFRPELRGGEDRDFFRRKIEHGYRFVWCSEAIVYEVVPPVRWKRRFMLRRALLRGAVARATRPGPIDILKSGIAVLAYTAALPFSLLCGQHRFMDVLIRLFDHAGKLLAMVHLNPVTEPYVTE